MIDTRKEWEVCIGHPWKVKVHLKEGTMAQALKKTGIKNFAKNDYLGSHFLNPELFQMKIFGCYPPPIFTFNLYLSKSWKQSTAAVKFTKI